MSEQVVNVSETWPEFAIRGLSAGHNYTATVTAYNSRGSAPAAHVLIFTGTEAQMHKSLPSRKPPSPMTLVMGVICGALLVLGLMLIAMWALRGRRRQGPCPQPSPGGRPQDTRSIVVGSGGLGMSVKCNLDTKEKFEVSDIQKHEKAGRGLRARRQPDPDILKSGTSFGSDEQLSSSESLPPRLSPHLRDATSTPVTLLQLSGSRPLLDGYGDLSPLRERGDSRSKTSVGDIMSGGDLLRNPVSGDLMRNLESADLLQSPGSGDLLMNPESRDLLRISGSGDLLRNPGLGDLLRTRDLLKVGEISMHPRGSVVFSRGVLSGSPIPRSSNLSGLRDSPSPVRGESSPRLRGDLGFDSLSGRDVSSCYGTLSASPGVTQHLLSGRDSIL
ncbi:uncharacterized protein LOC108670238 [Hyalella azteca]|uniref:Uncharacterized protein LOC108670238 n=1 Tax=Hyalella azteca TaxID=294128 RepID=A0A8B7NHS1_HYAAZ|nr:uncharacterized protein LOC108670238 [Hyalella azteca]